jgi:hypothetical protein
MDTENKPQITIYDNATGVTTVRDMTFEELEQAQPIKYKYDYQTPSDSVDTAAQ